MPQLVTRVLDINAKKSDLPMAYYSDMAMEINDRFPDIRKNFQIVDLPARAQQAAFMATKVGAAGKEARQKGRCMPQRAVIIFHSVADAVAVRTRKSDASSGHEDTASHRCMAAI